MTGIVAALPVEMRILREAMENAQVEEFGSVEFYTGKIYGIDVVTAKSGVGKVNAALVATLMLTRFQIGELFSIGMAGGIGDDLKRGDLVIARNLVQYDIDLSALGLERGVQDGRDSPYFWCDPRLVEDLSEAARKAAPVYLGTIATGDRFVADSAFARGLKEAFGALCVEMESCAVAQVAERLKTKFVACRVVSDGGGDDAADAYQGFEENGPQRSAEAVMEYLRLKSAQLDKKPGK